MTFCLSRIMSATFACRSSFGCVWHTRELNLYLTLPFPTLIIDYFLLKFPPQSRLLNFFCDKISRECLGGVNLNHEVKFAEPKIYAISFNSRQQHQIPDQQIESASRLPAWSGCPSNCDSATSCQPFLFFQIRLVLVLISQFSLLHIGNFVNHKKYFKVGELSWTRHHERKFLCRGNKIKKIKRIRKFFSEKIKIKNDKINRVR